ncbi:MAG: hypothetical protein QOF27_122 [Gaiellaceae bacterium]|jgi:hypothetical protein|nr:hypothetical protein [Gaiellaceae bacterium]MDX6442469.1 hypothetical protein [Gaiellaceae bacterium]
MKVHVLLAVLLFLALAPAAGASPQRGFAFGRLGGNIRPYTVSIAADGKVAVSGSATVGRMKLTATQLATLNRAVADARFGAFPPATNCPGTLPDIAATFIRFGAKTVRVHGNCVARYAKLFTALSRAVKLS